VEKTVPGPLVEVLGLALADEGEVIVLVMVVASWAEVFALLGNETEFVSFFTQPLETSPLKVRRKERSRYQPLSFFSVRLTSYYEQLGPRPHLHQSRRLV
jgi:hypothetical protein